MTSSSPLIYHEEFSTTSYDNLYLDYTLSYKYFDGSALADKVIYSGRTLCLDKAVNIRLDDILRDYVLRRGVKADFDFGTITTATKKTVGILPDDARGDIIDSPVTISVTFGGTELLTSTFVIGAFNDHFNTFTSAYKGVRLFCANASPLANHVPIADTMEYYVMMNIAKGSTNYNDVQADLYIQGRGDEVIDTQWYGNYAIDLPLADILSNIDGIADGDVLSLWYVEGETPKPTPYTICTFDGCPADYYLEWCDSNGWHSVPVSARESLVKEADRITTVNGWKSSVYEHTAKRWSIRSMKVSQEQYEAFQGIAEASVAVLYDSKAGRGRFVLPVEATIPLYRKAGAKFFEFDVEEIISSKY